MNYLHHPYSYAGHAAFPMDQPVAFDPAMAHPAMMPPMDGYVYAHPPFDMVDYYHQPIMDYEEYAENLSRPRLTKEQVETLEAQFQAHPKPSSNVKRQLAAQTNLSLPRVANWFQNRRAKAKQQKRQEEFERMQKAKAEAEEAARGKSENTENQDPNQEENKGKDSKEQPEKDTPKQSAPQAPSGEPKKKSSARSKHQKTRSDAAREATFASLQRALNAAVAARERDPEEENGQHGSGEGSLSPATTLSGSNNKHNHEGSSQDELSASLTDSTSWAHSQSPQETLDYSSLATSLASSADSLTVPDFDASQHQHHAHNDAMQFGTGQSDDWTSQVTAASAPGYPSTCETEAYNAVQYPQQSEESLSRRESSDELSNTFEGIGIHTGGQGLANRADQSSWKEAPKELDLAARRKRPRPAAIGTSRSSSMLAGSAMSPTARVPSGSVRQTKSTQSLNSRYAGVRKASAAQRSPLNLSTFAESGSLSSSKANDMSSMLQPAVTTGALAPPTPLTPEDLQHLFPTSPSDNYCLSAAPTTQLFPTTQPMQINIASPPATPMNMEVMSSYAYNSMAPPMSAPAHYSNFPEYVTCDAPVTARSWTDANSLPSPEASFQNRCLPQQTDFTSLLEQGLEHDASVDGVPVSGSPSLVYSTEDVDLSGDSKTEFRFEEFPRQQEAHRFVAQQLPTQKPKNYSFTSNTTPANFWKEA